MMNKREDQKTLTLCFSVIHRCGKVMHDRGVKRFGLTGQQMAYLHHICETPGIQQSRLARELKIDKGAVARAVKDMEAKGYIIRESDPKDKRACRLFPADTGRVEEVCRQSRECVSELESKMTAGMTDEEIETLRILLTKMTDNIEDMLEGGQI